MLKCSLPLIKYNVLQIDGNFKKVQSQNNNAAVVMMKLRVEADQLPPHSAPWNLLDYSYASCNREVGEKTSRVSKCLPEGPLRIKFQ